VALALYRKYRPATFAEVVGQEHVTEPLCTALAAKRVNHAYLFSGPRGCGKTSSARILARSLNCVDGPTPTPCGVCNSCVALAPEGPGNVDVVELDAASHGGVDDARELRDKAFYAPAESRYRVFIIDEAHMVTTQGFNALLKIVEEPPDHLVFIFATTEPDKVLPTIRSRTHHYPFRLIPPGAMRALLERNCAAEGVTVEPAVYPLVIRAGGGSARDTQSVLDQLLAGAGPGGVTYERAVALLGVTDVGLIDDIVDGLAAGDGPAVFGTVDRLVEAGHDPRRFTSDLLERLRDLVLLKAVPDAADKGLVAMPEDELNRMRAQAERLGPATLTRYAEILHAGLIEMRGATAPRLLVELLCARMLLPAASATDAAVLQRLEGLERRMTMAPAEPAAAPADQAQQPRQPAEPQRTYQRPTQRAEQPQPQAPQPQSHQPQSQPQPAAEPEAAPVPAGAGGVDSTAIRQVWPELLKKVSERSKPTLVLLQNATVKAVEGNTLVLAMPTPGLAKQLSQDSRAEVIKATLRELFNGDWQIQCVHGDSPAAPAAEASRRPATATRTRPVAEARVPEPPPAIAPPRAPEPPRPAAVQRRSAPPADVPPPPEPPDDDEPPPDPRDGDVRADVTIGSAVTVAAPAPVSREPDIVAVDMLTEHLRARRIH
jgi:DNA polymerase-3 subunit gamma/tau